VVRRSKVLLLLSLALGASPLSHAGDPTRPQWGQPSVSTVTKKGEGLTAIFTGQNGNKALIDGKVYKQGEYYQGQKILRIERHRVKLQGDQGIQYLTLIKKVKQ